MTLDVCVLYWQRKDVQDCRYDAIATTWVNAFFSTCTCDLIGRSPKTCGHRSEQKKAQAMGSSPSLPTVWFISPAVFWTCEVVGPNGLKGTFTIRCVRLPKCEMLCSAPQVVSMADVFVSVVPLVKCLSSTSSLHRILRFYIYLSLSLHP